MMGQLRTFSPLPNIAYSHHRTRHNSETNRRVSFPSPIPFSSESVRKSLHSFFLNRSPISKFDFSCGDGGGSGNGLGGGGRGGSGGGWSGDGSGDYNDGDESSNAIKGFGILGAFLAGWRSRVAADPQFPFKVLMEELVGVTACVLGDMASRPNFGLNELDFVFCTLVVGSILNFSLMYLLAPTLSSTSPNLPGIFASCPPGHMFEPGPYGLFNRAGTLVYKGAVFAAVGFGAGLVGTAISNGLIMVRKKMDPEFETPNKPPPTLLNACTWALHMGVSSNLRYQTLNGIEFLLERGLPPVVFKTSILGLRTMNNILGGMSFVILARLTGSQSVDKDKAPKVEQVSMPDSNDKFVDGINHLQKQDNSDK